MAIVPMPCNLLGTLAVTCASTTIGCALVLASTSHVLLLGSALSIVTMLAYMTEDLAMKKFNLDPHQLVRSPVQIPGQGYPMIRAGDAKKLRARRKVTEARLWLVLSGIAQILSSQPHASLLWLVLGAAVHNIIDQIRNRAPRSSRVALACDAIVATALTTVMIGKVSWLVALAKGFDAVVTLCSAGLLAWGQGTCWRDLFLELATPQSSGLLKWSASSAGCLLLVLLAASSSPLLGAVAILLTHGIQNIASKWAEMAEREHGVATIQLAPLLPRIRVSEDQLHSIAVKIAKISIGCSLLYVFCLWTPILGVLSQIRVVDSAACLLRHPAVCGGCALLAATALGACTALLGRERRLHDWKHMQDQGA